MYFKENLPLLFKQDRYKVEFIRGILEDECYQVFIQGKPVKTLMKEGLIRTNL